MFPYTISPDINADEYKLQFFVKLSDVWTMNSQVTSENPHGYNSPPSDLYADVDEDRIDIVYRTNQHYEQAEKLVEVAESHVRSTLEDEIEDFHTLVKPYSLSNF